MVIPRHQGCRPIQVRFQHNVVGSNIHICHQSLPPWTYMYCNTYTQSTALLLIKHYVVEPLFACNASSLSRVLYTKVSEFPHLFTRHFIEKYEIQKQRYKLTRENWLDAIEGNGEGQQGSKFVDGLKHDWTWREDESNLVVQTYNYGPKEEAYRRRSSRQDDGSLKEWHRAESSSPRH